MNSEEQPYNLATIRQLLLAAFTPEELRRFCYDRPSFRPIVDLFGPGLGFTDMVDRVVEYCNRYVLLDELLTELAQHNPRQYTRFIEPLPSKAERVSPTPASLTITNPIRIDLVRVPAGKFQMGSFISRDEYTQDDELPPHSIHIPEFHIARYPVTNTQYQAFVQATGHHVPEHWEKGTIPGGKENHPVVNVSWEDALAFCAWLAQESGQPFRLPTEAEWEKAARGTDGRIWPWGDEPPDKDRCNFRERPRQQGDTTPIGRYSPQGDSPYGCTDMAGNVCEWCQSLYRPYPYHAGDGREVLKRKGERVLRGGAFNLNLGGERVLRGGAFNLNLDQRVLRGGAFNFNLGGVRCAFRFRLVPGSRLRYLGFRVVVAPGPTGL